MNPFMGNKPVMIFENFLVTFHSIPPKRYLFIYRRHGRRRYYYFQKISEKMAFNVPAVYDVFASPIKETVGFQGLQKCGWSVVWEWSVAE
jgi:hypothetical protein